MLRAIYTSMYPPGQKPSQILRAEKPKTLIPYVYQDVELAIKRRLVLHRI
jgi:hypothetical protein